MIGIKTEERVHYVNNRKDNNPPKKNKITKMYLGFEKYTGFNIESTSNISTVGC